MLHISGSNLIQGSPEPKSVKIHDVLIDNVYFKLIQEGLKTVEGRLDRNQYKEIKLGDCIHFINQTDPSLTIFCYVLGRTTYPSFLDMLKQEGLSQCLPGILTLEEGEDIYLNIADYREQSLVHPIVAFNIEYQPNFTQA